MKLIKLYILHIILLSQVNKSHTIYRTHTRTHKHPSITTITTTKYNVIREIYVALKDIVGDKISFFNLIII